MAGERRINWGADATDARYRTEDTGDGGNFVVAEDLDGATVLLEYDSTASEWVSRGPVNMDNNAITNVSDIDVQTASASKIDTSTGYEWQSFTFGSGEEREFSTWYQAPSDKDIFINVEASADADNIEMRLQLEINTSQTGAERRFPDNRNAQTNEKVGFEGVRIPAGNYYRVNNFGDTGSYSPNNWQELR